MPLFLSTWLEGESLCAQVCVLCGRERRQTPDYLLCTRSDLT